MTSPLMENQSIFSPASQQGGMLNINTSVPNPFFVGGGQVQDMRNRQQAFQAPVLSPLTTTGRSNTPSAISPITGREAAQAAAGGLVAGGRVDPVGTSTGASIFDVLTAAGSGALTGAAVGGPAGAAIGGGLGLIVGAGKAFFSIREKRKQARLLKESARRAEEAQRAATAREIAWRNQQRLDTLRQQEFNRTTALIQARWANFQNQLGLMTNMMNSNQAARQNFQALLAPVGGA